MSRSQIPKGYKLTEVGVIPEDWQTSKIGEVCGFIVPGRNKPKLFDGDIPWITTPDLEDGQAVTSSKLGLCISRKEAKSVGSKIVPPGSVLMSCAGELGIVALTQNEIVVNQQLHVFIPTACIDGIFLLNVLAYQKDQIASYGTKTAVPYLNKTSCNSIPIPLPPIDEQRSLATVLSDTDALIAALDRLIAKKRDLKQSAMQQLLTGKTRLPGFGEGMGYQQTEIGEIPLDWNIRVLSEMCTKIQDGTHFSPTLGGNDFYYITSKNIGRGFLNLSNAEKIDSAQHQAIYKRCDVRKGDLLLTKDGVNTGNVALNDLDEEFSLLSSVALLRFEATNYEPAYFLHLILSSDSQKRIKDLMSGNAITRLTLEKIRKIPFPFPLLEEQTAISAILSDMDTEIATLEQRRDKTRALKQGMMQELLTGRIRLMEN